MRLRTCSGCGCIESSAGPVSVTTLKDREHELTVKVLSSVTGIALAPITEAYNAAKTAVEIAKYLKDVYDNDLG